MTSLETLEVMLPAPTKHPKTKNLNTVKEPNTHSFRKRMEQLQIGN